MSQNLSLLLPLQITAVLILATVPRTFFCDHLSKRYFHVVHKLQAAKQSSLSTGPKVQHKVGKNNSKKPKALMYVLCRYTYIKIVWQWLWSGSINIFSQSKLMHICTSFLQYSACWLKLIQGNSKKKKSKISGFHSRMVKDSIIRDAMPITRLLIANTWTHYVPLKCHKTLNQWHSITFQMTCIL